jgi:hypothetical protein
MKANTCIWHLRQVCSVTAAMLSPAIVRAEEDIRDIRGPKAVPVSWITPAILITALLAVLCAAALWRLRTRNHRPRIPTVAEEALARLESLRVLMLPDQAREFGIAASEILRGYIEKRFAVRVTRQTTEEFLQALLKDNEAGLAHHRPLLEEFLRQCDLVKFAGTMLSREDMESLLQSARAFVLQTSEPVPA